MGLTVNVKNDVPLEEVSKVIRSALNMDRRITEYKIAKYGNICKNFETKYGMNSNIFVKKFDSGELDDRDEFFDWYTAKKSLDIWNKKLEILSGINL